MKAVGAGIFYGSSNEAQLGVSKQGVVFASPFYQGSTLVGAIEIFLQTSILSSIVTTFSQSYVNISYIVDENFLLLATSSSSVQTFLSPTGSRLSALNSTDQVIKDSATFLFSQGVTAPNTFTAPFGDNALLQISLQTITQLEGIDLNWGIVSVSVASLNEADIASTIAPTPSPTSPTSSNSDSSILQTQYDIAIAGIVLGSLAALVIIGCAVLLLMRSFSTFPLMQRGPEGGGGGGGDDNWRSSDVEVINTVHSSTSNSTF